MKACLFMLSAAVACLAAPVVTATGKSCVTDADLARSPLARFARAVEDGDATTAGSSLHFFAIKGSIEPTNFAITIVINSTPETIAATFHSKLL